MTRRSIGAVLAALVTTLAVTATLHAPAGACSLAGEDLEITPAAARPGAEVTVTGSDLYYFETELGADCSGLATYDGALSVGIVPDSGPGVSAPPVVLGTATAVAGDVAATAMTIPDDAAPGEYGIVVIIEAGVPTERYPSRHSLTILGDTTTTVTPTTPAPTTTAPVPDPPARTPAFTG